MKKTLFASFLIGSLLTSTVSWGLPWPTFSSKSCDTLVGITKIGIGMRFLYWLTENWHSPENTKKQVTFLQIIMQTLEPSFYSVILIGMGSYSLYKGLIEKSTSSQQEGIQDVTK